MNFRLATLVIMVLSTLAAFPSMSSAQGEENDPQFSVAPVPAKDRAVTEKGYFVYKLSPGGRATGRVLLQNIGKKSVTINLALVDAATGQTGGSAFALTEDKPAAVGTWVKLDEPTALLEPNTEKQVGFTVQVPSTIKPGQYLAGIAAYVPDRAPGQTAVPGGNEAGAVINVRTRYVIAVQVDVPGTWTPSLTIPSVSVLNQPNGTYIGVRMKNDGGTFLKPSGSVTLTDSSGRQMLSQPIKLDTFVTGTEITYPIAWPGEPKAGKYNVSVKMSYAKDKTAVYDGTLEIVSAPSQTGESGGAPQGSGAAGATNQPAQGGIQGASGIQPWMLYALGTLLVLVVILLVLILLRGRGRDNVT